MENKNLIAALEYLKKGCSVIPFKPNNPGEQKIPYLKTWVEFQKQKPSIDLVKTWWGNWPNAMIGIVTGEISDLIAIDTDDEEATQQVEELLPEGLQIPVSISPGGGRHYHFRHKQEIRSFSKTDNPEIKFHIRSEGGCIISPPSTRKDGKNYYWQDGLSLNEIEPPLLPDSLYNYITNVLALVLYKGAVVNSDGETTDNHKFFNFGRRDEDLFSVANALTKHGLRSDFTSNVLERLIISWGENPDKRWIDAKIKSAFNRVERKERNIAAEVRQWVITTTGHFETTQSHSELQLTTKNEKKAVAMELLRLKEEGIIESYGDKRGCYRLIEDRADELDFMTAEDSAFNISWPLEIEKWVKILPKNIIVVAGLSNAGKTAFLLNVCQMNLGKFKIHYYSSEMGPMELRDRLKKFEISLPIWKENVNFRERSSNFTDVIKPNDVNIVDFLEITDEFYKIGGMIKQIWDKLKKGIAIIALQKNPKVDFGLGGMRSVEKARLYLAMENNIIKIVKGKNWVSETNPNGLERTFKLVQGSKFIPTTEWQRRSHNV